MAGVGFELRRLTRKDDLLGVVGAYAHSSFASAGPWIFTILSLGAISIWGGALLAHSELAVFRLITIYNFAFSLVFTAPVALVATRLLADAIYKEDVREAPGLLTASLLLAFVTQFPLAAWFYLHAVDLALMARIAALANYMLVTAIWVTSVFLTALKDYRAVSRAFGIGMLVSLICTLALAQTGSVAAMLIGFSLGLTIIVFSLISRILAEYPYPLIRPGGFAGSFRKYWQVALSGALYNAGIWIDKWVMWFAPERETLTSGMISFPNYDSATFLAYLTVVPSLAIFLVRIETGFFERYLRFYREIMDHASYERIKSNHAAIITNLKESGRNLLIFQGSLSYAVILTAPQILSFLDVSFLQLPIFRLAVLGALFHVLFLSISVLLSYFDMRRTALGLNILFLASNGLFSFVTMKLGPATYGMGYCLASVLAAVAALVVLVRHVRELPYQTFAANH